MPDYPAPPPIFNYEEDMKKLRPPMRGPMQSPPVERAINALRKFYGNEVDTFSIKDMPMDSLEVGSNVLGSTSADTGDITMNPTYSVPYPDHITEGTLAHELEHAREFRRDPERLQRDLYLPYDQRPTEHEADAAEEHYDAAMGSPDYTRANSDLFRQMPKLHPALKALLNSR